MSYKDIRLNQLLRTYIDGVPLDLASSLLPLRTKFSFSLLSHIHLHAGSQKRYAGRTVDTSRYKLRRLSLLGLIDNLESCIKGLKWQPKGTEWANYYKDTNYSQDAFQYKKRLVAEFLEKLKPRTVWDLGGNVGIFSRIASDNGMPTISFDIDPAAIEINYLKCVSEGETNILPLLIDLTNPSPGIGWEGTERMSLLQRGPTDTVLALALVHHLAISNNVPLSKLADFFGKICNSLIIEFVPKDDSQVKRLLSTRDDVFPNYTQAVFEQQFGKHFNIQAYARIKDSVRTLYLMRKKQI